tara:strand:- start:2486 stop:2749 length:264 start_codon:yes stop_codon:yes gene_type:complete
MATSKDYFDALYSTEAGMAMYAELWDIVASMPVESPDDAVRKLARYDMLLAMRERAGVHMGVDLIRAESVVATHKELEKQRTDLLET